MESNRPPFSVFITGIAGFIGFHLAVFLKKRGDHVIGCDNFNAYYSPALKKKRSFLLKEHNISVIDCDIAKISTLAPLFTSQRFSHVVHLAAQAGVRYSMDHPRAYGQANLLGTIEVLELCRNFQPLALIFASSSSVYGNTQAQPLAEHLSTDSPVSLYAATKKSGELLAKSYAHLYRIPTTVLRFFTCYGPWGRPDMAYFSFAQSILQNKPIELFEPEKMRRDFTYIDDTVRGIGAAMDSCTKGYQVYNIGSGRCETLPDLVHYLEKGLGKTARCLHKPMHPGDVNATWADIKKAQRDLGFSPKTSLKEGISRFAHWFFKTAASPDALCLGPFHRS